ncbi:hypothetical protein EV359DRAFT_83915 [Lentinula novae-zelandiae]|nr:hypothetical protein EV359DRAFT_83915 [Lentinula novae-zelandiae]
MSIRALRSLHKNLPEVKADEHILHFHYIHPSSMRPLKQPLAVKHSLPTAITGHAYLEQVFSETYLPDGSFVFFRHVHKYASDNELLLLFLKRYSAAPTSLCATFCPASCDNSICIHHPQYQPYALTLCTDPPPYLPKTYHLPSSASSTRVTPKTSPDTRKKPSYTYPIKVLISITCLMVPDVCHKAAAAE